MPEANNFSPYLFRLQEAKQSNLFLVLSLPLLPLVVRSLMGSEMTKMGKELLGSGHLEDQKPKIELIFFLFAHQL